MPCPERFQHRPALTAALRPQAKLLPAENVQLKVYGVSTHRLALYLASTEQLLPIVRATLLQEMGFSSGHIRLHNLV